uniref:Uncharacterized protein n=1 Tax=Cacopsylla melanoneura TaxID=428564 RepID=A0A8D8YIC1_9HEMI
MESDYEIFRYCKIDKHIGYTHRYKTLKLKYFSDHRSLPITFPITIFWTEEHLPARLLQLLLQMAGVERNPGPTTTWICSVCNQPLHCNITSVKCNEVRYSIV